jgi:hypothetical protein
MANKPKKPFKLNVLGLFKWESENWTVKEVALILAMIMGFILLMIIMLKIYAMPALTAPPLLDKINEAVRKIFNSRGP